MTHRQYRAWSAWLMDQWNVPDRSDHYTMKVAHEARYAFASQRPGFDSANYRITFRRPPTPEEKKAEAAAELKMIKAVWMTRLSGRRGEPKGNSND